MNAHLEELLSRMHALEEEVEEAYRQAQQELEQQKLRLEDEFDRWQLSHRIGLSRFLAETSPRVLLTAPVIYLGWIPFLLIDLFVSVYQAICFPVYGISKVRRSDYLIFDRSALPYLNVIEAFNCFYCSYANGVAGYVREVAGRTEQYWCPIKHARRLRSAHPYYPDFVGYGDAEAFHREQERLRQVLKDLDRRIRAKAQ
jgi:hypothetical protein